jgi:hypothetical protein
VVWSEPPRVPQRPVGIHRPDIVRASRANVDPRMYGPANGLARRHLTIDGVTKLVVPPGLVLAYRYVARRWRRRAS